MRTNNLAKNPVFHSRAKYMEINYNFIHEQVLANTFDICYIPTSDQLVDLFTIRLLSNHFLALISKLWVFRGHIVELDLYDWWLVGRDS